MTRYKFDIIEILKMIEQLNIIYRVGVPIEVANNKEYLKYRQLQDFQGRTPFVYMITEKGLVLFLRKSHYKNVRDEIPVYFKNTKTRTANNQKIYKVRINITNTLPTTRRILNLIYQECVVNNPIGKKWKKKQLSTKIANVSKKEELKPNKANERRNVNNEI